MKIKNILKKLGASQPETRNAKPPQEPSRLSAVKEPEKVSRKPNDASPPPQPDIANESAVAEIGDQSYPSHTSYSDPQLETRNSKPETLTPTLDLRNPATNRSPRGKVAHLPPDVREQVCNWISEGVTLQQIAKSLAEVGHPGFNHQNISNWKENGYRAWVRHQEQLEFARLRAEETIAFGDDSKFSHALLIARELHAANDLEEAMYAYDRNADEDTKIKQCKIIHLKARTYTNLNAQLLRSRKISADEKRHREEIDALLNQKTAAPLTEEAQRQALLDVVDKMLGIKPYRSTSSPAAPLQGSASICKVPGGAEVVPPFDSPLVPMPLSERNAQAPADIVEATEPSPITEDHSSYSDAQRETARPHSIPSPGGEGQGEGGLRSVRSHLLESAQPSQELEPWERLLIEPSISPVFLPEPPMLPRPFPADAKPLKELPVPTPNTAYPPAPLIQPERKLALCNYNGIITAWVSKSGTPSDPKALLHNPQPIKNPKTGETICWFDFHSRPPGMTDDDPVRGKPHFVPILNGDGRIIGWAPEPDGRHRRPPTLTAIPLESENPRIHFAWLEPFTGSLSRAATEESIPSPWGRGLG